MSDASDSPVVPEKTAANKRRGKAATRPSGVSAMAAKLVSMGLQRDMDLVLHLPMRYEDETRLWSIEQALGRPPGMVTQVEGVVSCCEVSLRPRKQLTVRIQDGSGELILRFLNFYGSQSQQMAVGARLRVRGEIRDGFFGAEMVHPAYKVVKQDTPLPTTLTPVYPATAGVTQAYLRRAILVALARTALPELLPTSLLRSELAPLRLLPLAESLQILHHPPTAADGAALSEGAHPAWLRIQFDELLAQQLSLKRAQAARRQKNAPRMQAHAAPSVLARFSVSLPFQLTGAQQRAWRDIQADLATPHPMQRLLQGDVGSGKTIVAALAAAQAIDNGYQVAWMAPTEILAEQHFQKLQSWLAPLGVEIVWLTGSLKARDKRAAQQRIAEGVAQLVVGTHALIQEDVMFPRLGLAIVDEQHRFGVGQRLALRNKMQPSMASDTKTEVVAAEGRLQPHQLMMTATPIPRTLAMTYYADLDVSVIDELPPGRTAVVTKLVSDGRRDEVVARVRAAALEGRQVYWVCPLIEESEALQLQTAVETYEALAVALPELQVALVHGRLSAAEKAERMAAFQCNAIQVLVATTVIEVGVDVPNASLMVIEHAERFGLAQLHQLRGRVGRGSAASACVLLYQSPLSPTARQRLQIMRETTDGFEIARRDLEIRGPGEFLGARQSGEAMLRFVDLERDAWLVEFARTAAQRMLEAYPQAVEAHLARWLGGREAYLKV